MKELAEAVQVTSAALYYHFKGKEDLFTRMIQTLFVDEGVAGIEQTLATTQDLRERLTLLTSARRTMTGQQRRREEPTNVPLLADIDAHIQRCLVPVVPKQGERL